MAREDNSESAPSRARREPVKAVRGVRDILPDERAIWRVAELAAKRVAHRFGYREIETPVIEHQELIERGVGEGTDAASKELYRFEDRGGREIALRPEATAGIVRAYFDHGLNQGPQPARLFLIGPMFRYDRPQKGRYRQFFQFNVEAIGGAGPPGGAGGIAPSRAGRIAGGVDKRPPEINTIRRAPGPAPST